MLRSLELTSSEAITLALRYLRVSIIPVSLRLGKHSNHSIETLGFEYDATG